MGGALFVLTSCKVVRTIERPLVNQIRMVLGRGLQVEGVGVRSVLPVRQQRDQ